MKNPRYDIHGACRARDTDTDSNDQFAVASLTRSLLLHSFESFNQGLIINIFNDFCYKGIDQDLAR